MKWKIVIAALLVAGCNRSERPEPPTEAETERLNDAEAMLNDLANDEGATPPDAAPSANSN